MFNSDSLPSFVFLSASETRLDASDEASDDDGGDDDDENDDDDDLLRVDVSLILWQ